MPSGATDGERVKVIDTPQGRRGDYQLSAQRRIVVVIAGLAFASVVMAYAATLETGGNFNAMFRFIITPLFLFSGVFFPTSRLPTTIRAPC